MRFAANISHLWANLPWLDRFDAAADAGFAGVEALFPYDEPGPETQGALRRNGLAFVLLNAPPPNYTGGDRGFAAIPGLEDRCAHDMRRAFRYAKALGAQFVHVMSGVAEGPKARATLVANLKAICAKAPEGITVTIEPLNPTSAPGYFLNDYALAADVIAEVDAPNLALQFDSFHAQVIHGDACSVLRTYCGLIQHIQFGDAPDRTAPGTGVIDFDTLMDEIAQSGYDGWIAAEYTPGDQTEKTLTWLEKRLLA